MLHGLTIAKSAHIHNADFGTGRINKRFIFTLRKLVAETKTCCWHVTCVTFEIVKVIRHTVN